ncbi:hypothetical protein [Prosthecobacter sp.]|uniref:hypothetical protein n=1 Tax=Prosthecobacter sp. TaxID=1965333 RepID=UPI00378441E8
MKRPVLFAALLLSVLPASAGTKNYGTIVTRAGKTFYQCQLLHVYPDGVTFAHRDGAAKIAFKELPAELRGQFHYDSKVESQYQKEKAAARQAELERKKQQEIVMQEQMMQAQMSEASYLAAASRIDNAPAPIALTQPGEKPTTTVAYQTPSWVGTPITGPAVSGRGYNSGSYARFGYPMGYYGAGYGGYSTGISYGYPYYGGYSYGGYPYYGGGYSYGSYPYYGGSYGPAVYGSWNVGHGIHVGVGLGGFGGFGGFGHHHH